MLFFSRIRRNERLKAAACLVILFLAACSGTTNLSSTQLSPTSVAGATNNPPPTQIPPTIVPTAAMPMIVIPTTAVPETAVPTVAAQGTTIPSTGNPTLDVCSFLTSDEVQPVVDAPVIQVLKNTNLYNVKVTPDGNCTFRTSYGGLALEIAQPDVAQGSAEWTQDQALFFTNLSPDSTTAQITGLGDAAVWMDNGKSAGGIGVAKYPYLIALLIGGKLPNHPAAYAPELRQLMELVLSRLSS